MQLIDEKLIEAARLLKGLTMQERTALIYEVENTDLHELECTKDHIFRHFKLAPELWLKYKDHMLDGGAPIESRPIATALLQSLFDEDQETHFALLIEFVKSVLKEKNLITTQPSGVVTFNGVGPKLQETKYKEIGEWQAEFFLEK